MNLEHSKRKGNVGELKVALECAKNGYSVFKELGDISRIDLIIETEFGLFKVQVKYVEKNIHGTYTVSSKKNGPNGYCYVYGRKEIDIFGVYCCNDDILVWIAASELIKTSDEGVKFSRGEKTTSSSLTLRSCGDKPKNNQTKKIRYLAEYTSLNRAINIIKNQKNSCKM